MDRINNQEWLQLMRANIESHDVPNLTHNLSRIEVFSGELADSGIYSLAWENVDVDGDNSFQCFKRLVENTPPESSVLPKVTFTGEHPLKRSFLIRDDNLTASLIEHYKDSVNELHLDPEGSRPLHFACKLHYNAAITHLLRYADEQAVLDQCQDGSTALHYAAQCGDDRTVKVLLKKGSNVYETTDAEDTALHLACRGSHADTIEFLLAKMTKKDSVNWKNENGFTPLHLLGMSQLMHADVAIALLNRGADLRSQDDIGNTPLMTALENNNTMLSQLILNNLQQQDLDESLHVISIPNKAGEQAIHVAARRGIQQAVVALIMMNADLDAATNDGSLPIHLACENKHRECVEILLENSTSPHWPNLIRHTDNKTPVMLASRHFDIEFLKPFADIRNLGSTLICEAGTKALEVLAYGYHLSRKQVVNHGHCENEMSLFMVENAEQLELIEIARGRNGPMKNQIMDNRDITDVRKPYDRSELMCYIQNIRRNREDLKKRINYEETLEFMFDQQIIDKTKHDFIKNKTYGFISGNLSLVDEIIKLEPKKFNALLQHFEQHHHDIYSCIKDGIGVVVSHHEVLRSHRREIVDILLIDPSFLSALVSQNVLNMDEKYMVESGNTPTYQNSNLIDILYQKDINTFLTFITCLQTCNMSHLATKLAIE